VKAYQNEDLIVYWYPELCAHPGICLRMLPKVFNLNQRPWVNIDAATPEEIIAAIDKCPSGALRYSLPEGSKVDPEIAAGPGNIDYENINPSSVLVRVTHNGPLFMEGPTIVLGTEGEVLKQGGRIALCRCGASKNMPFCDGNHRKLEDWHPDDKTDPEADVK